MAEIGGAVLEAKPPTEITTATLETNAVIASGQLNKVSEKFPTTASVLFTGKLIPDEKPDDPDGVIAREFLLGCREGKADGNTLNMIQAINEGRRKDINLVRVNDALQQADRLTRIPDPQVLRNHVLAEHVAISERIEHLKTQGLNTTFEETKLARAEKAMQELKAAT